MKSAAIVSVHDVMPSTYSRVERILKVLDRAGVPPATLLVVPGRGWSEEGVANLRGLAAKGHTLAGHGWAHKATSEHRTLYHRLHALLISRNEAEHLSLESGALVDLLRRSHDWFPEVGLPAPELYVPPAWALGSLTMDHLRELPFRWYEILRGYLDVERGKRHWLPLVGFEADTTFRQVSLRFWNGLNAILARVGVGPLRISIHPDDLDLLLNADVPRLLEKGWTFLTEAEFFETVRTGEEA
jgi:predicted deacetylase